MSASWSVADIPDLSGKRFFVTGANSGIGFWTAVELARHGATVVMACRDKARGSAALARLRSEAAGPQSAGGEAELVELDLASLESVKRVAEAEVARHQPLHGLINNAGVMAPAQRRETADGFELQFGTNVLGHFALTGRLMPAIEMARGSLKEEAPRIVTISSIAHKQGSRRIHFDDLQWEQSYHPMNAYRQSKLADLMFSFALERTLRQKMLGAISLAAHPGVAQTPLFKVASGKGLAAIAEKVLQTSLGVLFGSDKDGALPTLYAATAADAVGGGYYGPQGFQEMRGGDVGVAKVAPEARDEAAQKRLWDACEALTGVQI